MAAKHLDQAGRSALHYAAVDGNVSEARALLRSGENPNQQDKAGWAPLHFAAQEMQLEIAQLLVQAGAVVDIKDKRDGTPLARAVFNCKDGKGGAMINFLRQAGADPYAANDHGITPLALARMIANYDVAKYFADLPADA